MRRLFTLNPIKVLAFIISCLFVFNAQAVTYTAVASGWFTAGTTWQGTLVPSFNVNADTIIIPVGITVKLSQNLTLTGPGALGINGVLTSDTTGSDVILNSGLLGGSGTITVDSMEADMTSGYNFTGTINVSKFATTGITLTGSTVNVADTLYARSGTLMIASGTMNIANDVLFVYTNGNVFLGTGSNVNFLGQFHLLYWSSAGNMQTGSELLQPMLKNIEVRLPVGASLLLSTDMNANGRLKIANGILDLNSNNLNIGADGYLVAGNGFVSAVPPSSLIINSTNSSPGAMKFTAAGNVLKHLFVHMGSSSSEFHFTSELNVADTLDLSSGRLVMNNNELIIGPAGTVSGGSSSSYVIPGQTGSLRMTLTNGSPRTFMVGMANSFAPAMVMPNNVPSTGTIGVTVHPAVYVNSTAGEQIGTNQPIVNATWYVTAPTTSSINIDFEPMWTSGMEVNGFDRQNVYVGMYTQGKWDTTAASAASSQPNGLISLRRNNIKSLGAFAVLDRRAKTTDVKTLAMQNDFSIYPNPATDRLNLNMPDLRTNAIGIIYDATGWIVRIFAVQPGTIDIVDLPTGKYQLKITGKTLNATHSFLKL